MYILPNEKRAKQRDILTKYSKEALIDAVFQKFGDEEIDRLIEGLAESDQTESDLVSIVR